MASTGEPLADDIVDALFDNQATDHIPTDELYLTVFDDTDTNREDDFADAPLEVNPADWIAQGDASGYENDNTLSLGQALSDVNNIEDAALFAESTTDTLLLREEIDQAPFDVSEDTVLEFEAGDVSFEAPLFDD